MGIYSKNIREIIVSALCNWKGKVKVFTYLFFLFSFSRQLNHSYA